MCRLNDTKFSPQLNTFEIVELLSLNGSKLLILCRILYDTSHLKTLESNVQQNGSLIFSLLFFDS